MFIVVAVFALIGLLASLVYLADFARASRRDALFLPASSGRTRRARRVAGMYTRVKVADVYSRENDDQLVGR